MRQLAAAARSLCHQPEHPRSPRRASFAHPERSVPPESRQARPGHAVTLIAVGTGLHRWVRPAPRTESGRGQARPGPSHTTRHAGPHRAVRSAFPETAVGFGEPFQAHGLVPVGVRQCSLEWPGPSDAPVPLLRGRPAAGVPAGDTERAEVPVAHLWALPAPSNAPAVACGAAICSSFSNGRTVSANAK